MELKPLSVTPAGAFYGSVANNLFNLKKVEFSIISKTRFVVFARFFEFVGE
jgi:hypothetical protein